MGGIGLAMCKDFLKKNDMVVICSRSRTNLDNALQELGEAFPKHMFTGKTADVCKQQDMFDLVEFASATFGKAVDVFICNAGITQNKLTPLTEVPEVEINKIIQTNLIGTINGYKAAMYNMQGKDSSSGKGKGHIFFMEGAGSQGMKTANFSAYGVSKAGFIQLVNSLTTEAKPLNIGVHTLQPGMVITDLLVRDTTKPSAFKIFNILAEMPETVSAYLVPRIRAVSDSKKTGVKIRYLRTEGVIYRFLTFFLRRNRLIDEKSGKLIIQ